MKTHGNSNSNGNHDEQNPQKVTQYTLLVLQYEQREGNTTSISPAACNAGPVEENKFGELQVAPRHWPLGSYGLDL